MSQTLKLYIPKVLSENKLVILNGIGSLKINYRSASVDMERKVILPPREEIYFVPSNDSRIDPILVKIVEIMTGVGYDEATDVVYRFMREMRSELHVQGQVALPNIGWIRQDKWGSVFFEPAAEYISLNRYFGLNHVQLPQALTPAEQEVLADLKETVHEQLSTPVYDINKRRRWGFIISTILILLMAASLFLIRNWNESEMVHEELPLDTIKTTPTEDDSGLLLDPESEIPKGSTIDVGPNFVPVIDNVGEVIGYRPDPALGYCKSIIVVGAFAQDRNVRRMVEKIRNADHESVLIPGAVLTKVGLQIDCEGKDQTLAWARQNISPEAWVLEGVE